MKSLAIENRQRVRAIDIKFYRAMLERALQELLGVESYEIALHLVNTEEMARVNQQYLSHEGSTDVITFDLKAGYDLLEQPGAELRGEIFISVQDGIEQAERFGTNWQEETVRYAVHGFLHLLGFDDLEPEQRRQMKRKENAVMKQLCGMFTVGHLGK